MKERHFVLAASQFNLKLMRVQSDLYELKALWNEANFCKLNNLQTGFDLAE